MSNPTTTIYRGSIKHKKRPNHGMKGTLCPEWTHSNQVINLGVDVTSHPWAQTEAAVLFSIAIPKDDSECRYATAQGIAFEARSTNDGTWHGFPVPWESVPPDIKSQWIEQKLVDRRDLKRFSQIRKGDIDWAMETEK